MFVSILVLMDLCIKTVIGITIPGLYQFVSILVLMDLCIKTEDNVSMLPEGMSFNPCFNGSMYKNCNIASME